MSNELPTDEFRSTGPPPSGAAYQAELARLEPPRGRSFTSWFFVLFMIGVVVGPLTVFWLPGEIARWHQAAIIEQWLNGDLAGAIKSLDHVIGRYPDQAGLYLQRAEWNLQIEDYQAALADCDQALQLVPNSHTGYQVRSQAKQHQGDYDAGVQDMKKVLALSRQGRPGLRAMALNGLAYARALAKTDLDDALEEIQEVLAMPALQDDPALLDTRGYIYYLRRDFKSARADLDRAVELIEQRHAMTYEALMREHPRVMDLRVGQQDLKKLEQSVAVLRYHRALLYEALRMQTEADQDRERVRELGFEPGEHLF